jgi:hypothetical protein
MMDTGKSGGLNNEGMQILVTNRAVEFGHKVYTDHLFPRLMEEMDVTDWKLTLYPNEEEDEVTRLRRDEMEVNIAQRMMMMGYKPTLSEDANRDIRFIYKQPDPMDPAQQQGGAPPGGMPMGGMQMGGGMGTPGALPGRNISPQGAAQMARQAQMGMSQPGGEGMGLRNRGPASPQNRTSMGSGAPMSSVQQRGPQPTGVQQASQSILNARNPKGA